MPTSLRRAGFGVTLGTVLVPPHPPVVRAYFLLIERMKFILHKCSGGGLCPSQGPRHELASLELHFFGDCALEKGMGLGRMGSTWVEELALPQLGTQGLLGTALLPGFGKSLVWDAPALEMPQNPMAPSRPR